MTQKLLVERASNEMAVVRLDSTFLVSLPLQVIEGPVDVLHGRGTFLLTVSEARLLSRQLDQFAHLAAERIKEESP